MQVSGAFDFDVDGSTLSSGDSISVDITGLLTAGGSPLMQALVRSEWCMPVNHWQALVTPQEWKKAIWGWDNAVLSEGMDEEETYLTADHDQAASWSYEFQWCALLKTIFDRVQRDGEKRYNDVGIPGDYDTFAWSSLHDFSNRVEQVRFVLGLARDSSVIAVVQADLDEILIAERATRDHEHSLTSGSRLPQAVSWWGKVRTVEPSISASSAMRYFGLNATPHEVAQWERGTDGQRPSNEVLALLRALQPPRTP